MPHDNLTARVAPRYLTTKQKAAELNVSASWLEHDRQRPVPTIPFVRIGPKLVRYPVDEAA